MVTSPVTTMVRGGGVISHLYPTDGRRSPCVDDACMKSYDGRQL